MAAYLRRRDLHELLPWDHIDCMVDKQYFVDEYWRSRLALLAEDCRQVKCHQCGVIDDDRDGCLTMLRTSRAGRSKEANWQRTSSPVRPHTLAQQKMRFRFAKQGPLRFLSHLETMRAMTRALRRAQLPVHYSQGFHPQPLLTFATALPVGIESTGEYADVVLSTCLEPGDFQSRLDRVLPAYMRILDACPVSLQAPSLMSERLAAQYDVVVPVHLLPTAVTSLATRVQELLACDEISVQRWHKKGPRRVNIRPGIVSLEVMPQANGMLGVAMLLREETGAKAKPAEVMQALLDLNEDQLRSVRIIKHEAFVHVEGRLIPIMQSRPQVAHGHEV
jgi:radical SAM-linked protein